MYQNEIEEKLSALLEEFELEKRERNKNVAHLGIEAYRLAKETGDSRQMLKAATALSHYYTEITSDFHKAVKIINEFLPYLDDFTDCIDKAEFYRRLGLNHDFLGEQVKAKEAYDHSIRLIENTGIHTPQAVLTLARSLFNLSIIYGSLSLENLSEEYLKRAYKYFTEADYKPGIARCYISFGVALYEKKGEIEETLSYYRKAAALALELNDDPPYCIAMGNIGIVNAESGNFEEAISAATDALTVATKGVNKGFQLSIHRQLGRIYQLKKDYATSNHYFAEGEKLFIEMGAAVDHMEFYRYWSETLAAMGNHSEAYEKLSKFVNNQDTLHKTNREVAVNDAMLRFQLEEGKKEQELLRKKNEEIELYARKLEISNSELNQFAHVASHDMKEPLRMVTNYSQLLKKSLNGHLKAEQQEYLDYVNDGAKRMVKVINSLLDLSKINASVKPEPCNLNEILDEVKQNLQLQVSERKAVIFSTKLPEITADKTHMLQLLQNLIGNALKYNKSVTPTVAIEHYETDNHHHFSISDNGIGIEKEYREKVFAIFQRLHERGQYDGNGIGLSICRKIVNNLAGNIWVEDSMLGGSKFCFTLPKQ